MGLGYRRHEIRNSSQSADVVAHRKAKRNNALSISQGGLQDERTRGGKEVHQLQENQHPLLEEMGTTASILPRRGRARDNGRSISRGRRGKIKPSYVDLLHQLCF
jgi:hypothetical protein